MKTKLVYPPDFWVRAIELQCSPVKTCEQCYVTNGMDISRGDHPKKKNFAVVRVALREGTLIDRSNLGLFCTRCRRGPRQVKARRKDLEALILPLFNQDAQTGQ